MNRRVRDEVLFQVASAWPDGLGKRAAIEVGLSGGLDSVVLLHVLWCLRAERGFVLSAVHVHHGLNDAADEWADFCRTLCLRLGIPLRTTCVKVNPAGLGVEAAARQARYEVLAASTAQAVALAHHADDQVETFWLAALRGGGIRGLAAMPAWRELNDNLLLWRPLLGISREMLLRYAESEGLAYVQDDSNEDTTLLRNWLRHQGLPLWRQRVPHLNQQVLAGVSLLQEELALLDELAAADWAAANHSGFFDCSVWRTFSQARRRKLLVSLVEKYNLGAPGMSSICDFERVLYHGKTQTAQWQLPRGEVYAAYQRLFVLENGWENKLAWFKQPVNDSDRLKNNLVKSGLVLCKHSFGLSEDVLQGGGGVRMVCADDDILLTVGHKNVRKILQECKVPAFVRKYWPVVTDGENRCIAIANIWVSRHYGCLNGFLPVFEKFNPYVVEPK